MPVLPETAARLDNIVADAQREGRTPSMVAGVVRDGSLAHVAAAGTAHAGQSTGQFPAVRDSQHRIGSITKTFTATLIMQLRDEGLLELDEPLSRRLPDTPVGDLRIRQLLSHISGLQREPEGPWWERASGEPLDTFLKKLGPHMLVHPPHRIHHYSNLAYALLGAVASRAAGEAWMDLVEQRLLTPLQMRRTTYQCQEPFARGHVAHPWHDTLREEPRHDGGAMAPAGQLWSTVEDLAVWAAFVADPSPDVINPATLTEMCAPVVISDLESWSAGHGLGFQLWRRGERVLTGHSGSMPGYLALLATHRASGTAAVAFSNAYNTKCSLLELCGRMIDEVLDREPARAQPWLPAAGAPPEDVAPLCGRWWFMGQEMEVRHDNDAGELVIRVADTRRVAPQRFQPEGRDRWRGVSGFNNGELLTPHRDATGAVVSLNIATFELTRDPFPDI